MDSFKGFGPTRPPKFWLQTVSTDDKEDQYIPCYGGGGKAKHKAIALLANQAIEYVILLRGQADTADITQADILADFQREHREGSKRIQ